MAQENDTTAESAAGAAADAPVVLVFLLGGEILRASLQEGQSLRVGRDPSAEVVLAHPSVSRKHARFSLARGVVRMTDDGAKNGVMVNGSVVSSAEVWPGDAIRLGDVDVWVLSSWGARPSRSVMLSPRRFVLRVDEELERARYTGRAVHVLALRGVLQRSEPEWVNRVVAGVRSIDRVSDYAPNVLLVLLVEQDAAAAVATAEQLRARARAPTAVGLVASPPGPMNGEALIAAALDAAQRADVATRAHVAEGARSEDAAETPVIVSPVMQRLMDLATRTAHADLPLCIYGETGSGKEVVARAFHDRSRRARGPFCEVNCAAIAPSLVESLLFGHEKGAFTGADKRTAGLFEQADGGTLFLDEVGELSSTAQRALLRALETKRVRRVGATQELPVDVRVIAATHRNLRELVVKGEFREDLLYRLEGLTVRVPPLRERAEEIEPLAEHFLRSAASRWNGPARAFSEAARLALKRYFWPGNVRQLRNAIERATAICTVELVELDDLPEDLFDGMGSDVSPSLLPPPAATLSTTTASLADEVRSFELARIRDALTKAQGNRSEAARILGIPRRTLGGKIKDFGLG